MLLPEPIIALCEDLLIELRKETPDDEEIREFAEVLNLFDKNNYIGLDIPDVLKNIIYSTYLYIKFDYLCLEDGYKKIDYSAMSVYVQFLIRVLFDGVKNKNIEIVTMTVGFNDILVSYEIEYNNEVIDIHKQYCSFWEKEDKLYNYYRIFENNYIGFDTHTIQNLCSDSERFQQLLDRKNGTNLISYNSAIGGLVFCIENELKKIVRYFNPSLGKLELYKTLVELKKVESENVGLITLQENYIDRIDDIREKVRNPIGHSNRAITLVEAKETYSFIMESGLLQLISNILVEFQINKND